MSDRSEFELEDDPPTPARPPARPTAKPPQPTARAVPPDPTADEPVVSDRRKVRLHRLVPGFAVGFLLVGWICMGTHAWPFALTGAALGAWASWNRRSEAVLGTVAAVVGLATYFGIVGFLPGMGMGIVIVGCGIVGFLAGLDDRLRGPGN